jgi:hypothetical protein
VRKRKTTYPPPKTANRPAPAGTPGEPVVRSTVATINVHAVKGRSGLQPGGRVRVLGTGRHAGEIATIEKLVTGGIPQAIVRTDDGQTSRVRTIDLEPVNASSGASAPPPPANSGDGSAGRPDA